MKLLDDTLFVFARSLRRARRAPHWLMLGLSQPLLYLALFAPLVMAVASVPGFPRGTGWQVFIPGLLVQLALFGSAFAGFDLVFEQQAGVLERLHVTPVRRSALLLGRVAKDVLMLAGQSTALIVVAVFAGMEVPLVGILAGLPLILLLGIGFAAASYTLALYLATPDSLAGVLNAALLPMLLLSGILLPMSLAPSWLDALSKLNPLRWVVEGERAAFRGEVVSGDMLAGLLAASCLAVLPAWLGVRAFNRAPA